MPDFVITVDVCNEIVDVCNEIVAICNNCCIL